MDCGGWFVASKSTGLRQLEAQQRQLASVLSVDVNPHKSWSPPPVCECAIGPPHPPLRLLGHPQHFLDAVLSACRSKYSLCSSFDIAFLTHREGPDQLKGESRGR